MNRPNIGRFLLATFVSYINTITLSHQGLFSRITFNQPVYVGGVGEMRHVANFLGLDTGFQGCVRALHINQRSYDLRPALQGGDVIGGLDIGEFLFHNFKFERL